MGGRGTPVQIGRAKTPPIIVAGQGKSINFTAGRRAATDSRSQPVQPLNGGVRFLVEEREEEEEATVDRDRQPRDRQRRTETDRRTPFKRMVAIFQGRGGETHAVRG